MELIPILSLIILVSTISTFILAIGAYVLYKVRERKGRTSKITAPETVAGEVVAPTLIKTERKLTLTSPRSDEEISQRPTKSDFQRELRSTGEEAAEYSKGKSRSTDEAAGKAGATKEYVESKRYVPKKKYLRVTDESSESQEVRDKEDNLRWR